MNSIFVIIWQRFHLGIHVYLSILITVKNCKMPWTGWVTRMGSLGWQTLYPSEVGLTAHWLEQMVLVENGRHICFQALFYLAKSGQDCKEKRCSKLTGVLSILCLSLRLQTCVPLQILRWWRNTAQEASMSMVPSSSLKSLNLRTCLHPFMNVYKHSVLVNQSQSIWPHFDSQGVEVLVGKHYPLEHVHPSVRVLASGEIN